MKGFCLPPVEDTCPDAIFRTRLTGFDLANDINVGEDGRPVSVIQYKLEPYVLKYIEFSSLKSGANPYIWE